MRYLVGNSLAKAGRFPGASSVGRLISRKVLTCQSPHTAMEMTHPFAPLICTTCETDARTGYALSKSPIDIRVDDMLEIEEFTSLGAESELAADVASERAGGMEMRIILDGRGKCLERGRQIASRKRYASAQVFPEPEIGLSFPRRQREARQHVIRGGLV